MKTKKTINRDIDFDDEDEEISDDEDAFPIVKKLLKEDRENFDVEDEEPPGWAKV